MLSLLALAGVSRADSMVTILDYHQFAPNGTETSQYITNYSVFMKQMDWLQRNNYHTITLARLVDYMANGTPVPQNTVVLTFSDGWKTDITFVQPVLKSHGFVGTFCIVAGYMANSYPAFMNTFDVKYLQGQGDEICGHTYNHLNLVNPSENPNDEAANWVLELNVSTNMFRSNGINVTDFNVPYCQYNESLVRWVEALGYRATKLCENNFQNFSDPSIDPRFDYTMFGTNAPYWGITDVEPNATLANITVFANLVMDGDRGPQATITTTIATTAISSTTIHFATTTISQNCMYRNSGGADDSGWWCFTVPGNDSGEELSWVTRYFGICTATLVSDNNIPPDAKTYSGEVLRIPNGKGCPVAAIAPDPGITIYPITIGNTGPGKKPIFGPITYAVIKMIKDLGMKFFSVIEQEIK